MYSVILLNNKSTLVDVDAYLVEKYEFEQMTYQYQNGRRWGAASIK